MVDVLPRRNHNHHPRVSPFKWYRLFEKWDKSDSPGCALGVYKDGQIIYKQGYGMADLENDIPITPATVFHVASMSKQFTVPRSCCLHSRENSL